MGVNMANRFSNNVREWIFNFLCIRDGKYCIACGPQKKHKNLEIDHADGNEFNDKPENLHLTCQKHNLEFRKLTPRQHVKLIAGYSAKNVCVCVSKKGNPSTELSRYMVDYTEGSPEMRANSYYEVKFREWVLEENSKIGAISKKEVINSGAEVIGCSPATIGRYLDKLTSSVGALMERKDSLNQAMIISRPIKPVSSPKAKKLDNKSKYV
jgi:hypothetical protein